MKKLIVLSSLVIPMAVMAQTPENTIKYNWQGANGTARVQALGGASGALGGEISTLFSNPANIGFYKNSEAVISGGVNFLNNKSTFYGDSYNTKENRGFLGTTGLVFGRGRSQGRSGAFSVGVTQLANFNNQVTYFGHNNDGSSMADAFIADVKNHGGDRDQYGSDLAYKTYWINPTGGGNYSSPASAIAKTNGLFQDMDISTSGQINELAFGGGKQVSDRVYLGATVGIPMMKYDETRRYYEEDPTNNNDNDFKSASYNTKLMTNGEGFNIKLGALFNLSDRFRVGLAAHTPTWYSITQSFDANADVNTENLVKDGTDNGKAQIFAQPDHVLEFDYRIRTPYKVMGSATALFGDIYTPNATKGFITGDIEYIDYSASKYSVTHSQDRGTADEDVLKSTNSVIKNAYKGAVNVKLGTEVKFNTLAVRLGGAYFGGPYNDIIGEKGSMYQASGGLGYRGNGFFIDLAYVHNIKNDVDAPYRVEKPLAISPAEIKTTNSRLMLTLGVKL
ncbi:MAG: aromatic hydrocarbon degradation protein [Chitinophagaceae bacterium]|nr:MAG: aromatic hydrocarbon degradation protein [Chitinophagaceae bacterium]